MISTPLLTIKQKGKYMRLQYSDVVKFKRECEVIRRTTGAKTVIPAGTTGTVQNHDATGVISALREGEAVLVSPEDFDALEKITP